MHNHYLNRSSLQKHNSNKYYRYDFHILSSKIIVVIVLGYFPPLYSITVNKTFEKKKNLRRMKHE